MRTFSSIASVAVVCSFVVFASTGCSKSSSSAEAPADQPAASGTAAAPAASVGILGAIKNAVANSQPFEGEISASIVEENRPPQNIDVELKADKIRFDMKGKGAGILDIKAKKLITVIDPQKKYMEMDFGNMRPQGMGGPGSPGAPSDTASPPKIDKTGHHETIAGHDCEDWIITDSAGKKVLICMASDIGGFDFGGMEGASFMPSIVKRELFGGATFPIKMVDYDVAGKERTHMEVTKIDRKPEDDALFVPPVGYTKLDLGTLGGMMGAGGMGGPAGLGVMGRPRRPQ